MSDILTTLAGQGCPVVRYDESMGTKRDLETLKELEQRRRLAGELLRGGVRPAGVWRAPGGKFRVADPAADGLERAAPDEPGPATESRGSDAMEADAVAFPKQGAARQGLLIAFSDESGLSERSVHARPCHGRV